MFTNFYKSIFRKSLFEEFNSTLEEALNITIREVKDNSYLEAIRWHSAFKYNFEKRQYYNLSGRKIYINESISHRFKGDYRGGMITFSTDVNAVIDKKDFINTVKGFFKSKIQTIINRFRRNDKIFNILKNMDVVKGYSVGNLFRGRYFDRKTGHTYDEKSLSIEIIDIQSHALIIVAEAIAKEFNQKEVLVKDYNNGRIMLVDTK